MYLEKSSAIVETGSFMELRVVSFINCNSFMSSSADEVEGRLPNLSIKFNITENMKQTNGNFIDFHFKSKLIT